MIITVWIISPFTDKRPMMIGIFQWSHKPIIAFNFYDLFLQEILHVNAEGGIKIRVWLPDATEQCHASSYIWRHTTRNVSSLLTVFGNLRSVMRSTIWAAVSVWQYPFPSAFSSRCRVAGWFGNIQCVWVRE